MDHILLKPEAVETLEFLVEAARKQPRDDRQPFRAIRDYTSHRERLLLLGSGIPRDHPGLYPGDVTALDEAGLLSLNLSAKGTWTFEVTALGERYYSWLHQRAGHGAERIESVERRYTDTSGFAHRHPAAFAKWQEADALLWGDDSDRTATLVGHLCREAHQAFGGSLLALHPIRNAPAGLVDTKRRVGAVLADLSKDSKAVRAFAVALGDYWEAVVDLAQRQEHGAKDEGQFVGWEDARRLVFSTLHAMTEIDRLL